MLGCCALVRMLVLAVTSCAPCRAERPDVSYSLVAVDFLPPPAVNATLTRLARDLSNGALHPLPRVLHELRAVRAALRQMSQARHVGKIVVRARTMQQQHGECKASSAWLMFGVPAVKD